MGKGRASLFMPGLSAMQLAGYVRKRVRGAGLYQAML